MTNQLPKAIAEIRDELAIDWLSQLIGADTSEFARTDFNAGFNACFSTLLKLGPSGDYDENVMCSLASRKHGTGEKNGAYKDGFIDGNSSKYLETVAALAARDQRIAELEHALKILRNETKGTLSAHEIAIRYDHGNSNWACLEIALNQADQALSSSDSAEKGGE